MIDIFVFSKLHFTHTHQTPGHRTVFLEQASPIENEAIDVQIYDIKKCFDKMWARETSNDLV
jgi:hypothetical protein